jgi:hypothetical protein
MKNTTSKSLPSHSEKHVGKVCTVYDVKAYSLIAVIELRISPHNFVTEWRIPPQKIFPSLRENNVGKCVYDVKAF